MIFRTLIEAQKSPSPAPSWKQKCIVEVKLSDGRIFYRTYISDYYEGKCRQCRNSRKGRMMGDHRRLPCTGHTCEICGNPFAAFTRQHRSKDRNGVWETWRQSWSGGGRLH